MHSTPVLLAPRPVRLTSDTSNTLFTTRSPHHHLRHSQSSPRIRTVPLESTMRKEQHTSSGSAASPTNALVRQELSQSPRPEEALEEFLSIFRSTTAASPPPTSFLFSPSPTRMRALMPYRPQGSTFFAVEEVSSGNGGRGSPAPIQGHEEEEVVLGEGTTLEVKQNRWFSSHLSSPISRTNTRNPFQRHPSYDIVVIPSSTSFGRPASAAACSRLSSCVSPANIPLPPTPAPEVA